jgi:hypothetical protein
LALHLLLKNQHTEFISNKFLNTPKLTLLAGKTMNLGEEQEPVAKGF